MTIFNENQTVAELVTTQPAFASVFQDMGIDFCCGGKKNLAQASREHEVDLSALLQALARKEGQLEAQEKGEVLTLSLTELADQIESTHHAYLKDEIPRLLAFTEKVARVHGDHDPRLLEIKDVFARAVEEIEPHMLKEEQVLFPAIRQLEASGGNSAADRALLQGPIQCMEIEHESLGEALRSMRRLSDGYQPPEWACNTYRAMLDGLHRLEKDLHLHVHKENNVLFPRALEWKR